MRIYHVEWFQKHKKTEKYKNRSSEESKVINKQTYKIKKLKGMTYYQRNKEKIKIKQKEYLSRPEVKLRRRKLVRDWVAKKSKESPSFRLEKNLRIRIWHALNGKVKSKRTKELLGCNVDELKIHLENKFSEGMTWDNYGKWHVDHIKPCSLFDLTVPEEQLLCFNYTNLQPLWSYDNQSKSDTFTQST
jgi:hypothetical protein